MLSKRNLGLLAAVALMFLAFSVPQTEGQSPAKVSPVQWEYNTTVLYVGTQPDETLNDLSRKGWELAAVGPGQNETTVRYIMKRPCPPVADK